MSDENYSDVAFRLTQEVLSRQTSSKKSKPSDVIKVYLQCHQVVRNTSHYQKSDEFKKLETLFNEIDGKATGE